MRGGVQAEKTGPPGSGLDILRTSVRGPFHTAEGVWEPLTGLGRQEKQAAPAGAFCRGGELGSPLCVRVRCPLSPEHGTALLANRGLLACGGDAYLPGVGYICSHA